MHSICWWHDWRKIMLRSDCLHSRLLGNCLYDRTAFAIYYFPTLSNFWNLFWASLQSEVIYFVIKSFIKSLVQSQCNSSRVFSARCNIYISRLCYDVSVCLSVCDWSALAPVQPTMRPDALRVTVLAGALWSRCMPGREEGSSRAMLATARPSCLVYNLCLCEWTLFVAHLTPR